MSSLDDLERKLRLEVDKEVDKWSKKTEFEKKMEMNKTRLGCASPATVFSGLKILAYGVVRTMKKIRDF